MGELLQGSVETSPFAQAMEKAKHVLVVPNCSVSIYRRIWCVYEAYLAVTLNRDLSLASHVTREVKIKTALTAAAAFVGAVITWCILIFGVYKEGFWQDKSLEHPTPLSN